MTGFEKLCEIVARLRAPDGCPWDREQTHESLLPGLLEEAYEVVGAVRAHDTANLREELGDLLLLVVMQAQIASEGDHFQIDDVIAEVAGKLVRRHPHARGAFPCPDGDGEPPDAPGRMEKTCLRRSDFTLFQNHQARGDRAALEAQLRLHFHSYHGGLGDENFSARAQGHRQRAVVLPGVARGTYSLLADRLHLCRNTRERDRYRHLRQQKNNRRNC